MNAAVISALSSGHGKTMFTMALLNWLKNNCGKVRPYKVGPDFIDTQFHSKITGNASINLDLFMMSKAEMKSVFTYYSKGMENLLIEGVMGFYDGMEYDTSTYDVAKALNVPTILIITAKGSYSTIVPTLKGILDYRKDNTVKGIILNHISSQKHYELIESLINAEIPELKVLGWIKKDVKTISSRHLGLDLTEIEKHNLDEISDSVMENINTQELLKLMEYDAIYNSEKDFFIKIPEEIKESCKNLTISIVNDKAFSFTYKANIDFLQKIFNKYHMVSAVNDEEIPYESDVVYIPGGYIETPEVASLINNAEKFKNSLRKIVNNPSKSVFAECAGLMLLGEKVQAENDNWINGAGVLPLNFEIQKRFQRLGYYRAIDRDALCIYKGHAFHYSKAISVNNKELIKFGLFKDMDTKALPGGWVNESGNVLGTYLHSFLFNQPELIMNYFIKGKKNDKL